MKMRFKPKIIRAALAIRTILGQSGFVSEANFHRLIQRYKVDEKECNSLIEIIQKLLIEEGEELRRQQEEARCKMFGFKMKKRPIDSNKSYHTTEIPIRIALDIRRFCLTCRVPVSALTKLADKYKTDLQFCIKIKDTVERVIQREQYDELQRREANNSLMNFCRSGKRMDDYDHIMRITAGNNFIIFF